MFIILARLLGTGAIIALAAPHVTQSNSGVFSLFVLAVLALVWHV